MAAQLLANRLAIGHLRQQINGASHDPHHITFIQRGIGDQIIPGHTAGPGLHQSHEFRLPPCRNNNLVTFLNPQQFPADSREVMKRLFRPRRRWKATPEVRAVDFGADGFKHRCKLRRRQIIKMATHQRETEPKLVVAS